MMQDIHRWSADTSMASPEDMIDQDGSVTLEALSKLQVLLPSYLFKTICSWKTDERTSVIYNLARVL